MFFEAHVMTHIRIGLPYVRNFPDMSGISVLKSVSGNNF